MRVKSVVSAVALTATLLFSGSAFAQTMFNGAELSADDLPKVQQRCDDLNNAESTESLTESDATAMSSSDSDTAGETAGDATVENAPAVNEVQNATTTIDLATVTIEQCKDAGLSM